MKLVILFTALFTGNVTHASCGGMIGTFKERHLSAIRVDNLVGQMVTVVDSRGRRQIHGVMIATGYRSYHGTTSRIFRLLDSATNEVMVLEYGPNAERLKTITAHGEAPEIRELSKFSNQSNQFTGPAIFSPVESNLRSLHRDLDLDERVRIVVANEQQYKLEILEGILTLPRRDTHYVSIQTANGPRQIHQLRIVAAQGQLKGVNDF